MNGRTILFKAILFLCLAAGTAAGDGPPAAAGRLRVGLVLGGGGARGLAHIGVLKELERCRVPIDCIAGTSMGAVVGGLYAAGLSAGEIESEMLRIDWADLFSDRPSRRNLSFQKKSDARNYLEAEIGMKAGRIRLPPGLVAGQKLDLLLTTLLINAAGTDDFEHLPIPFQCLATDIASGETVLLKEGRLMPAIRASMSVPGVFAPVELNNRLLVDGGLVNNLPVEAVQAMGCDLVIAVDVGYPLLDKENLRDMLDIVRQVMTLNQIENTRRQVERLTPSDLLIKPELDGFSGSGFNRVSELVARGESAVRAAEPRMLAYRIDEEAYRRERDRIKAFREQPVHLDFVEVDSPARIAPEVIRARLKTQSGEPLNLARLRGDVSRVYELGFFDKVDFEIASRNGRRGLLLHTDEKRRGYDYLSFGLSFIDDFQGGAGYDFLAGLTRTALNPRGGEWRTRLRLGSNTELGTSFYQPIDYGGIFYLLPRVDYRRRALNYYLAGHNQANYRISTLEAGLEAGFQWEKYGIFSVAAERGWLEVEPAIGYGPAAVDRERTIFRYRLAFDQLDSANFPRHGGSFDLQLSQFRKLWGGDDSYDRLELATTAALSRSRNTWLLYARGGEALESRLPYYADFTLGGLFSLSGYPIDSLRGNAYLLGGLIWFREVGRVPFLTGLPLFAGFGLEAGNAWAERSRVALDDLKGSGLVFLGADTYFGPLFLAGGFAESREGVLYLYLGRRF
ncbi:MAG TPA: patatin-like phospholipase family protein [bacterium]|nr:patatin-like phospholipase family protein [bacterium]HNS48478.1 patatin-like phospholipase family protein [bacterium]